MIRIGVIGVGHLGRHHARKFAEMSAVQMAGIFDASHDRAMEIGSQLNVPVYKNVDELLSCCDAVDIAATTTAHYQLANKALDAGKHVFLEKPITSELWQAEELVKLASDKGLKLQIGHIERFNPVTMKVEHDVHDPMFIESHRLSTFHHRGTDVPVVLDLMIHDIDLILDFVNSPVKDIRASGVGILTPSIDIANARIEFENGAIANVTSSRVSMKQERKLRFFQRDAYFSLDFGAKQVTVMKKSPNIMQYLPQLLAGTGDIKAEQLVDVQKHDLSKAEKDALSMELESFVDAIVHDRKPVVDGYAGMRALHVALIIMDKIKAQAKTHF